MAGTSTSRPMAFIGRAVLCLSLINVPLWALDEAGEAWAGALNAFDQGNGKQACEKTRSWLSSGGDLPSRSPEAHHNLALCSWMQKEADVAVFEALSSLRLQNFFPKITSEVKFIADMQHELGIQNSYAATLPFLISSLATPLNLMILISTGFWLMAYRKIFLPQSRLLARLANTGGGMLVFLGTIFFVHHYTQSKLAVLFGDSAITVYNFASSENPTPLAELPRGTVVVLGRERPGYIQILEPVPGWVSTASAKIPLS